MKIKEAALAAVLLLTLTGCASTAAGASGEHAERASTAVEEPTGAPTTPDPLIAEPDEAAATGSEGAYLAQLREALEGSGGNSIPDATDEQLIQAGLDACEQMATGTALEDVRVIEKEPETGVGYKDSLRIAAVAAIHYCTEFNPGG